MLTLEEALRALRLRSSSHSSRCFSAAITALGLICFISVLPVVALGLTPSAVTLVGSPSPSNYGQPVRLQATVTSGATGKVTFYDGATVLGVGTISGSQATLTTVILPSGSRLLRAYYSGDATYAASSSPIVPQSVVAGASLGFRAPISSSTTLQGGSIVVGDFNGDGIQDFTLVQDNSRCEIAKRKALL